MARVLPWRLQCSAKSILLLYSKTGLTYRLTVKLQGNKHDIIYLFRQWGGENNVGTANLSLSLQVATVCCFVLYPSTAGFSW